MLMRPKTISIFDCVHSRKLQAFWLALLLEDIWVAVSSTSLGSSSMSLRSLSSVLLCSVEFKMICREIHHHPIKLFRGLEHGQEHDSGWNLYDPEQEVLWTPGWGSKRIVNGGLFRICILKSSGFPNLGQLHVCTNLFANSPTLPRYNHQDSSAANIDLKDVGEPGCWRECSIQGKTGKIVVSIFRMFYCSIRFWLFDHDFELIPWGIVN